MKFHKAVARITLLYDSQTWVTTERDMAGLEAAEMCFIRSVKGYTGLNKIRSEGIRKELKISPIQSVKSKYKQNRINHLKEWITPYRQNTPSTTKLEVEEIVDAPGNDGHASMPEQVKQPNKWRKKKMMMN
jgi:hypothetical protein